MELSNAYHNTLLLCALRQALNINRRLSCRKRWKNASIALFECLLQKFLLNFAFPDKSTSTKEQQNTFGQRLFRTVPVTDCFLLGFILLFFTWLFPSRFTFCLKIILHIISREHGLHHLYNLMATGYL